MSTAPYNDGEAIAAVVSEPDLLVGSSQYLDDDIGNFNFSDFELRRIDDEDL